MSMPPISSKLNWPRTKQCEQCRRILEPWQDRIERHCVDTILTSVDTSSPFFGPDLDGRGGSDGDFDEDDIYMYNDEATVCLWEVMSCLSITKVSVLLSTICKFDSNIHILCVEWWWYRLTNKTNKPNAVLLDFHLQWERHFSLSNSCMSWFSDGADQWHHKQWWVASCARPTGIVL